MTAFIDASLFGGLLAWVAVGLIPGFLAARVYRGGGYGVYGDSAVVAVGVVAGVAGGVAARAAAPVPDPGLWLSLLAAAAASTLVVWAVRFRGPPEHRRPQSPRPEATVAPV